VLLLVNKHSTPDDDNVGKLTHVYKLIRGHAATTAKKIAYLKGWLDFSIVSLMQYIRLGVGELQHSELTCNSIAQTYLK